MPKGGLQSILKLAINQMTKICQVCLIDKCRQEFYHNITMKDGYTNTCKKCMKEYQKLYMREYRKKQKKNTLPFVYHSKAPLNPIPVPNNVQITHTPITIVFE